MVASGAPSNFDNNGIYFHFLLSLASIKIIKVNNKRRRTNKTFCVDLTCIHSYGVPIIPSYFIVKYLNYDFLWHFKLLMYHKADATKLSFLRRISIINITIKNQSILQIVELDAIIKMLRYSG